MKLILDTMEQARLTATPSDAMQLADAIAELHALERALDRYSIELDELPGALDDLRALREHVKVQPFDVLSENHNEILCETDEGAFAEWLGELERLAE